MKKYFNIILCLFVFTLFRMGELQAQTDNFSAKPSSLWAKQVGGPGAVYVWSKMGISADNDGNTYVTGSFSGTITFSTLPTQTQIISEGDKDIFIAKYDASGNVLWAKRAGGSKSDNGNAIKYDGFGNVYVVGFYTESATFGSTSLSNPSSPGSINVFVAKYSASTGDLLWARQGAHNSGYYSGALDVAVDDVGDVYFTGQFVGPITFDPLPTVTSLGWWDIFVVKYNSSGAPQWVTTVGSREAGWNGESGNGIAVDQSGNVFITGSINGSSKEPTYFGNTKLVSVGGGGFNEGSYFLAKYNPATSAWDWAVTGGGSKGDFGSKVSLDAYGNLYVNGYFEEKATFDSFTISSVGPKSYFVAKYTPDGNVAWVHPTGGTGFYSGNGGKVDAKGNFYFAGTFDGTTTIGNATITSNGWDNSYIANWNSDGVFQWVKHIPGSYYASVQAIDVESNGNINILGFFAGTQTFDCTVLSAQSDADLAIAKLGTSNSAPDAPALTASANNICSGNSTTLSISSGNLNNATDWKWYTGDCGSNLVGSGTSITVSPTQTTTYYVRGEGGCAGFSSCSSITIMINNTPPEITSITAPVAPITINSPINLNVSHTDNYVTSAIIQWGDASAVQTITNPTSSFTVPHTYSVPGVYTIEVTLTNACGLTSKVYQYQYMVVYDPDGGFVTGGGWINSPFGSLKADPGATGKANFGFVSKYQKGASVPTGNTQFEFKAGSLNFQSTFYEWLVVSGAKAQYKGEGTINGLGNYRFLLSAIDGQLSGGGGLDKFRIKIWNKSTGAIVYDNNISETDNAEPITAIGGGSIVIHSANGIISERIVHQLEIAAATAQLKTYPNPFRQNTTIEFSVKQDETYSLDVYDVRGSLVKKLQSGKAKAGSVIQTTWWPEKAANGVFIIQLVTQSGVQHLNVVLE